MGANTVTASSFSCAFIPAQPPKGGVRNIAVNLLSEKGQRTKNPDLSQANAYKIANPYTDGSPFLFPKSKKKEVEVSSLLPDDQLVVKAYLEPKKDFTYQYVCIDSIEHNFCAQIKVPDTGKVRANLQQF